MLKISLLFMSLLTIMSCAESEDLTGRKFLKVGIPIDAVSLYPYGSNDTISSKMTINIFDRLVEVDSFGNFQPGLAESWEMETPTTVRLNLRSNVTFHNGAPFTAKDVEYSIAKMIVAPEVEHISNPIKNTEILDNYTILVHLHKPFAPIIAHFTHATMAIVNKEYTESAGDSIDQKPVGTGPYKLKTWNKGENLLLEANTVYWGGVPKIDNLDFIVIPEAVDRVIALEDGEIDIAYDIDGVYRNRVSKNKKLQLIEKPVARIEFLGFNIEKGKNPIWKDQRVREAVALAIDIDGIIESVLFGTGTPADSLLYKTVIGHYDGLEPRTRDVEKAKELLAEAGVEPGTKVRMWTSGDQRQKILEVVQVNLREIGLDASIEVYEWGRFLDGTGNGLHDMFVLGWTTVTGDADYGIYNQVHTKAFGSAGNRAFYSNIEVDNLLDLARVELDPVKRADMYKQIQEILYEDLPFIPIFYKLGNVGASRIVKGFNFDPSESHRLRTVYFSDLNN